MTPRSASRSTLALALVAGFLLAGTPQASPPAPSMVVVTFAAPPTLEQAEMLASVASGVHRYAHLPAAVAVVSPALVPLLRELPGVRGVYPNAVLEPVLFSSTGAIRATGAWADGYTGAGIGIAVVDAGVDGTHPDLCAAAQFCNGTPIKTVQNVKFIGNQTYLDPVVVLEDQISTDSTSGHGSHVAGIAAGAGTASQTPGQYRGVAHGASLIGLGTGEVLEVVTVLAAFDWILANHAAYNIKVVNNSWGPGAGAQYDAEEPVQRGIAAMHDAGLSVVFGAGNDGPKTGTINAFSINPKALSAAGSTKSGHAALFSSRGIPGSTLLRPTVATPGQFIASVRARTGFYADVADVTGPDSSHLILPPDNLSYGYASGTSMSAPHVAGVVALMQEAAQRNLGRYLTPAEVRNALQNTAVSRDPARGPSGLPQYQGYTMGAGFVDALAAVRAVAAGSQLQAYNDGVAEDVRAFSGAIGVSALLQASSFETTYVVSPGAVSLDVMADWQHTAQNAALQDLDIDLYRPDGSLYLSTTLLLGLTEGPNQYSSLFTNQPNERINVVAPVAGAWRAVVKGNVSVSETVHGLWSTVYPDGTALAPAPAPHSVTVTGPASPAVAGQPVTLTAIVRDASGVAVPNAPVTWSSTGVGTIATHEPFTDERGMALATARSAVPGVQTATARAGSASGAGTVEWIGVTLPPPPSFPPPPANTPGKASGGGNFMHPNKRHFAFSAEYAASASSPGGSLTYDDKGGTRVSGDGVDSFVVTSGNRATIKGPASVNGVAGYRYELGVVDNGEPGRNDTISLKVMRTGYSYETGGTLSGGNLQVEAY